jgi:hypothetical protein
MAVSIMFIGVVDGIFVGVVVGVGAETNAVQLTMLLMLKTTINNIKKVGAGFDVIFIPILYSLLKVSAQLIIRDPLGH